MGLNISAGSGEDVAASMRFAFSASRCEASDEVRRSFAHRGHEMCKGSLLMFFASPIDSVEKKMAPIPLQQKLKKLHESWSATVPRLAPYLPAHHMW